MNGRKLIFKICIIIVSVFIFSLFKARDWLFFFLGAIVSLTILFYVMRDKSDKIKALFEVITKMGDDEKSKKKRKT